MKSKESATPFLEKKETNYLPTTTKRNNVVAIFIFDPVLIITILKILKSRRFRDDPEIR